MALFCGRRVSNKLLTSLKGFPSLFASTKANKVTLKFSKYVPNPETDHDLRNMAIKRPLSPHLTIYAPELTSMCSIGHRMTGSAYAGYFIILGCGSLLLPGDVNYYATMIESLRLPSILILGAKFCIAFPISYHMINGIRHLNWDTGRALDMKGIYMTGYVMLGSVVLAIVGLMCL